MGDQDQVLASSDETESPAISEPTTEAVAEQTNGDVVASSESNGDTGVVDAE